MASCEAVFVINSLFKIYHSNGYILDFGMEGVWWELGDNYLAYEVYIFRRPKCIFLQHAVRLYNIAWDIEVQ